MKIGNPVVYGSHLPILMKLVERTDGPILEVGMGFNSTPYLHWKCWLTNREYVSYDADSKFFNLYRWYKYNVGNHKVYLVDDWNNAKIEDHKWDVVLIDCQPDDMRKEIAVRLANNANYILLHDSESELDYHFKYSEIYPLFKYRYDYSKVFPRTTVLSNLVDLDFLKEMDK